LENPSRRIDLTFLLVEGMNGVGKNKMRKAVFTIDRDHKVGVSKGERLPSDDSLRFASERELGRLAAHWPGLRLVEVWNQLPGVKKVTRFTDRNKAIHRIWIAVQDLASPNSGLAAEGLDCATKTERVVALLKGPSGASLRAIMDLTGWQAHSVRGFISAQLAKRMGFQIQSFKRDGKRIYRIRS